MPEETMDGKRMRTACRLIAFLILAWSASHSMGEYRKAVDECHPDSALPGICRLIA